MKVINIFSGPCTGKSTTAAGLFYEMKKLHLQVELVTEVAKDMVWEKRYNILEDQIYVFAKQQRRIARLLDHDIEWVITDSPIPLGLCYVKEGTLSESFYNLVMEVFNNYTNYNFLLHRNVPYTPIGRNQTEEEAKIFDTKAKNLLHSYNIPYEEITGGEPAVTTILQKIGLKP
jgi:tRNA uridine 5-carbamoylmethylation protein Kti12